MPEIFLNCDLGEWETVSERAALMQYIDMANIACGGHAGNSQSIRNCSLLAEKRKPIAVSTGAHPGVASADGGRSLLGSFTPTDFHEMLKIQIQRYISNADLNHIKLHGALYHLVEADAIYRKVYLDFVQSSCLISIVCIAGGNLAKDAEEREMPIIPEVFLDRHYTANGSLLPRSHKASVIENINEVIARIKTLQQQRALISYDGTVLEIPNSYEYITACVHSDSPNSLGLLKAARNHLDNS